MAEEWSFLFFGGGGWGNIVAHHHLNQRHTQRLVWPEIHRILSRLVHLYVNHNWIWYCFSCLIVAIFPPQYVEKLLSFSRKYKLSLDTKTCVCQKIERWVPWTKSRREKPHTHIMYVFFCIFPVNKYLMAAFWYSADSYLSHQISNINNSTRHILPFIHFTNSWPSLTVKKLFTYVFEFQSTLSIVSQGKARSTCTAVSLKDNSRVVCNGYSYSQRWWLYWKIVSLQLLFNRRDWLRHNLLIAEYDSFEFR